MDTIGTGSPRENSTSNDGQRSFHTVASAPDGGGIQTVVQLDADGKRLRIWRAHADGAMDTGTANVSIDLDDIGVDGDGVGLTIKARETIVCVEEDGSPVQRYAMALISEPYGDPTA